jgi:hypothetical protein
MLYFCYEKPIFHLRAEPITTPCESACVRSVMQFAAHECPPGSPIRLDYQLLGARIVLEEAPQPAALALAVAIYF